MESSSQVEADGFVLVTKNGLTEDDAVSVDSDRSSLCVVDDPSTDPGLFEDSDTEDKPETVASKMADADTEKAAVLDSDTSETENLAELPDISAAQKADTPDTPEVVPAIQEPKYTCQNCRVDIAAASDIVWEGYMGANVPAVLFKKTRNTESISEARQQQLSTGMFLVQDVRCRNCSARLGWTYLKTMTAGQEYKVGTTIVQRAAVSKVK